MSIGIGANARLVQADETMLVYAYCCYNLNLPGWEEHEKNMDGEIYLLCPALPEPPNARTPSGRRRRLSKTAVETIDLDPLLEKGIIQVKNASGTWRTDPNDTDCAARRLIGKILNEYQISGTPPQRAWWFC